LPALYSQWFDFLFLGSDKFTVWNAYICTARLNFWEKITDIARERAHELLSPEEREEEFKWDFVPASRNKLGQILTYTVNFHQQVFMSSLK
jgi:hypothetical protein